MDEWVRKRFSWTSEFWPDLPTIRRLWITRGICAAVCTLRLRGSASRDATCRKALRAITGDHCIIGVDHIPYPHFHHLRIVSNQVWGNLTRKVSRSCENSTCSKLYHRSETHNQVHTILLLGQDAENLDQTVGVYPHLSETAPPFSSHKRQFISNIFKLRPSRQGNRCVVSLINDPKPECLAWPDL